MLEKDFEKLVKKAIMTLPGHIRKKMDNVAIVIEKRPSQYELKKVGIRQRTSLLGLYQGVPKTTWGRSFMTILPDKITIFQESIENLANSKKEIMEIIKNTVWHEIAHHFGFSEKGIRALEVKQKKKDL
ncbi:metallopeptidase family protein [Patescibacteria group bacterium]|nr:metallopeptidase family protein [Patescibacteria group bacterium]